MRVLVAAAGFAAAVIGVDRAHAVNPPGLESFNHFMCYGVKELKKVCFEDPSTKCKADSDCVGGGPCLFGHPKDLAVTLEDQFETETFLTKKPKELCAPADKNGETPGVEDDPGHLKAYPIKTQGAKHVKQRVNVQDQFADALGRNNSAVETIKEDLLFVPTAKSLTGTVDPLPPGIELDHFKCYKAKQLKKVCLGDPNLKCKTDKDNPLLDDCPPDVGPCASGLPKGLQVTVTDQFQADRPYEIKKIRHLCNPVNKNGEDPDAAGLDIHYACYQAKPVKGEAKHVPVENIRVNNQFGPEALATKKEVELCVPALKNPCGDGTTQVGVEECDDGNLIATDGCTTSCTICGDTVVTAPEECDDGNLDDGDGCDSNCTDTACGNGVTTSPETCDDGNTDDNDDCPADCIVDPCDPLLGSSEIATVSISSGGLAASVTVLVDYPEGEVSIPGSGGSIPPGIISIVPFGAFGSSNDLDHALRQVVAGAFPFADGPLFTIDHENCAGAPDPPTGTFTCTVLEAFDASSAPLGGVTCSVSVP